MPVALEQIDGMSPRECWHALQDWAAYSATVVPVLMVKAGSAAAGDDQWLTVGEVARRLHVSASAVRMRAATDPRWEPFSKKVGKSWRFKRFEFERYSNETRSRGL